MTTTTPKCSTCGRPIHDSAYLCADCTTALSATLTKLADLHPQIQVTLTLQAVIESSNGAAPPPLQDWADAIPGVWEQPAAYHLGASAVADDVGNVVTTWARVILEERKIDLPPIRATMTIGPAHVTDCRHISCKNIRGHLKDSACVHATRFVLDNVWWLRRRPEAPTAYDDLTAALRQIEHLIDTPAPRIYAGPCNVCRQDLYARAGAAQVECLACDMVYDMAQRREYLLECASDRLERAGHIARAVTELGSPISAQRIRTWAGRGQIRSPYSDPVGRPLYRVGDVLDLLNSDARHVSTLRRA